MSWKESLVIVGSIELHYTHHLITHISYRGNWKLLAKFCFTQKVSLTHKFDHFSDGSSSCPLPPSLPLSHYRTIFSDLSSLGASLLSPILRSSDTESIKSDGDAPATKRRRLSVSSQEMLEHLVHRASPLPLVTSPRDRRLHGSPPQGPGQHQTGPYTRRQRNLSNRWTDRQALPPRSNHHRRRWEETSNLE